MTKWQRLLLYTLVAFLCLCAVMLLLVGSTLWWQDAHPVEAGIGDGRTVTHFSNLWAENYFTIDDQTTLTVTDTDQIDPYGSFQPLTAVGTSTCGLTIGSSGDFLYLVNTSAESIIITDQTTVALAGNATLGQYDSLYLICDGTRWIELSRSNN